jgi:excisionase family DNA binding protein
MLTKEEMRQDMDNVNNNGQMDDMLTVKEVSRILHVHPNTLRRWSNNGRIKAHRINPRGDRRYKREEIDRLLAQFNSSEESTHRAH